MRQIIQKRRFTIIELLTGLVILTMVVLGTSCFFAYSLGQMKLSRQKTLVLSIISTKLDEMYGKPFAEISSSTTNTTFNDGGSDIVATLTVTVTAKNNNLYTRTGRDKTLNDASDPNSGEIYYNTKIIKVKYEWGGATNNEYSLSLYGVAAEPSSGP